MHQGTTSLYAPTSTLWRVHRELLVMLAGSRALLLELAHPMIAAGVAQHSDFRRRPLRRLFNTLRVMQRLSFGEGPAIEKALRHYYGCHPHVHGSLDEGVGRFHAGASYDATDPHLRLWVFATLIDSVLLTYSQFVRPLSIDECEGYYQDSKRMAKVFGIPPDVMPTKYSDFQRYVAAMIDERLAVGSTARDIMQALFRHPLVGPVIRLVSFAGIGALPEHLREAYGLRWDDRRERWLRRVSGWARTARRVLPDLVWLQPDAVIGEWRFRRALRRAA